MENITFKTEGGHEVVIKSFITGYDSRAIEIAYAEGIENGPDGKPTAVSYIKQYNKSKDRAIEIVVVSVDGKTEDILKEVLSLPTTETKEIIVKINEVTEAKKKEPSTPKT